MAFSVLDEISNTSETKRDVNKVLTKAEAKNNATWERKDDYFYLIITKIQYFRFKQIHIWLT